MTVALRVNGEDVRLDVTDRTLLIHALPDHVRLTGAANAFPTREIEPGLVESSFFDPPNFTQPSGVYIVEVEIDPQTGVTEIVSFGAANDFGTIANPMIVEGQIHGGRTQGIGQALWEECRYDPDTAQLITASYLGYGMPRADGLPEFRLAFGCTPSPSNPLGMKGCGEAGAIGSAGGDQCDRRRPRYRPPRHARASREGLADCPAEGGGLMYEIAYARPGTLAEVDIDLARMVAVLDQQGDMTAGEIVRVMALPQSTISHRLKRLESLGYIRHAGRAGFAHDHRLSHRGRAGGRPRIERAQPRRDPPA